MQFQNKIRKKDGKYVTILRCTKGGGAYIQTRNLLFKYTSPYACGGGGGVESIDPVVVKIKIPSRLKKPLSVGFKNLRTLFVKVGVVN